MSSLKLRVLDYLLAMLARATGNQYRRMRKGYLVYPRTRKELERLELLPVTRHYYEPYVDERDLYRPLDQDRQISGLDLNEAGQLALLPKLNYQGEIDEPEEGFGGLDGNIYYSFIRHLKPRRIVEIGSGRSAITARAALAKNREDDPALSSTLVAVEPFENPWLEQIVDKVVRSRVELCDDSLFTQLEPNDILFIDSTHVIRPQGDVLHEYLCLLGRVKPGVVIHIHDVFTPKDYPRDWVVGQRRMWNEQYLLEAYLCFNSSFEVLIALNHLYHHHFRTVQALCGAAAGDQPGSFWIRRVR
jgi:hypothetical protein